VKYDWNCAGGKPKDGYEDGHAKFGYSDLFDADGKLIDGYITDVDTETGECTHQVRDANNHPVHENGEMLTIVKVHKAPLTIKPIPAPPYEKPLTGGRL